MRVKVPIALPISEANPRLNNPIADCSACSRFKAPNPVAPPCCANAIPVVTPTLVDVGLKLTPLPRSIRVLSALAVSVMANSWSTLLPDTWDNACMSLTIVLSCAGSNRCICPEVSPFNALISLGTGALGSPFSPNTSRIAESELT